eukprot:1548590-Pleurochrysis_carterae.AAC.3
MEPARLDESPDRAVVHTARATHALRRLRHGGPHNVRGAVAGLGRPVDLAAAARIDHVRHLVDRHRRLRHVCRKDHAHRRAVFALQRGHALVHVNA